MWRDPEFIPSVPEPTQEERAFAWQAYQRVISEHLGEKDVVFEEHLPADAIDILNREHVTRHERAVFEREYTRIIPERMLQPESPLQLDDILSMLHVYYWWSEAYTTPDEALKPLLMDLDDDRFVETINLLHTAYPGTCTTDRSQQTTSPLKHVVDGYQCFQNWLRQSRSQQKVSVLLSRHEARGHEASKWLMRRAGEEYDEVCNEEFCAMIGNFAVRKLLEAGLDGVEAGSALDVLERERERRYEFDMQSIHKELHEEDLDGEEGEYVRLRRSGIGRDETLAIHLPRIIADNADLLADVLEEYEDIPVDAEDWPIDKKSALVKRFITENPEYYEQLEANHLLRDFGIRPYYQRRFAEEYWPPDQRC